MEQSSNNSSRKKFLLWGAAALSSIGFFRFFKGSKPKPKPEPEKTDTVKMLTQDGKLVEIDSQLLANATKKASKEEIQKWINKN